MQNKKICLIPIKFDRKTYISPLSISFLGSELVTRYYTIKRMDCQRDLGEIFNAGMMSFVKGNEWIEVYEKNDEFLEFVFFKKYMRTISTLDEENEITKSQIPIIQNTVIRIFNGKFINFLCGLNRAEFINRRLETHLNLRTRHVRINLEETFEFLMRIGYLLIPESFRIENYDMNEYVSGSYLGHTSSLQIFKSITKRYRKDISSMKFDLQLEERKLPLELLREGMLVSYSSFDDIDEIMKVLIENEKVIFYE